MSGPAARFAFPLIAFMTWELLLQRRGRVGVRLQRLLPGLARADAVAGLDRQDEHLAVAHGARAAVLEDRVHDRLHVAVGHHALDLDLRPQVVRQLRPAVALGDPLLPPRALDFGDRQRREPELEQLGADGLEGLVPDVGNDHLHAGTSWVVGVTVGSLNTDAGTAP